MPLPVNPIRLEMKMILFILLFLILLNDVWSKPISQKLYEDINHIKCPAATSDEVKKLSCLLQARNAQQSYQHLDDVAEKLVFTEMAQKELQTNQCLSNQITQLKKLPDLQKIAVDSLCKKLQILKMSLEQKNCLDKEVKSYENLVENTPLSPENVQLYQKTIQNFKSKWQAEQNKFEHLQQNDILLSSPTVSDYIQQQLSPSLADRAKHRLLDPLDRSCQESSADLQRVCQNLSAKIPELLQKDLTETTKAQETLESWIKNPEALNDPAVKTQLWKSGSRLSFLTELQSAKDFQALTCRLESRYGEGAQHEERLGRLLLIGGLFIPLGQAKIAGQAAVQTAKAAYEISAQVASGSEKILALKKLSQLTTALRLTTYTEIAAGITTSAYHVNQGCFKEHLLATSKSRSCENMSESTFRNLFYQKQNAFQCELALGMAALNVTSGLASLTALSPKTNLFSEAAPLEFGKYSAKTAFTANEKIQLTVWNVHKGTDLKLPNDFAKISADSDLVLFQEAMSHPTFTQAISQSNPNLGWGMARSWSKLDGSATGVATASKVKPVSQLPLVSEVTEPISNTPKSAFITKYPIAGETENLTVVNVHAINFVTQNSFTEHINQIIEQIKRNKGPMIFAGDFNTWSPARLKFLTERLQELGLTPVTPTTQSFLKLDHVFVRQLSVQQTKSLAHIKSSDHEPLSLTLKFDLSK